MQFHLVHRLGLWFTGGGLYYAFVWFYDYFVFSYVIWIFGAIKGGIIMMIVTFLVDVGTLKFYDWSKHDWLALETLKNLGETKGTLGKVFRWFHSRGAFLVIIFFSIKFNPFIVTAYLRKGAYQYNGLTLRDWIIFISSSLIGGLYWIVVITTGVSLIQYLKGIIIS